MQVNTGVSLRRRKGVSILPHKALPFGLRRPNETTCFEDCSLASRWFYFLGKLVNTTTHDLQTW